MAKIELTEEAWAILDAAVKGGGVKVESDAFIYVGEKDLVKRGASPREIAFWIGGLRDLMSKGMLDLYSSGTTTSYRVTREGYIFHKKALED